MGQTNDQKQGSIRHLASADVVSFKAPISGGHPAVVRKITGSTVELVNQITSYANRFQHGDVLHRQTHRTLGPLRRLGSICVLTKGDSYRPAEASTGERGDPSGNLTRPPGRTRGHPPGKWWPPARRKRGHSAGCPTGRLRPPRLAPTVPALMVGNEGLHLIQDVPLERGGRMASPVLFALRFPVRLHRNRPWEAARTLDCPAVCRLPEAVRCPGGRHAGLKALLEPGDTDVTHSTWRWLRIRAGMGCYLAEAGWEFRTVPASGCGP